MTDKPTAVELIREGHAEGDRVVAMHVAWEAIATLTAERDALVEALEVCLESSYNGPMPNYAREKAADTLAQLKEASDERTES